MMRKSAVFAAVFALATFGSGGTAWATSASGTVAVSVTVASSLNMVFQTDASGLALTNTGTSAVTASFGTMSAYGGTVPTGVTRTLNGTTSWTITTPFDVVVTIANQTSSNYTLTAQLQTADAVNTWKINTTTVNSSTASSLTTTGNYGNTAYTLGLTIPFTEAATTISNTINFVATAN